MIPPRPATLLRRFTLLELVCVLVVIAAFAALVAPRLSGTLRAGKLEQQARTVVALAKRAKSMAAIDGRAALLVIDREARELRLAQRRDPLAAASDPDDPEREPPADERWAKPFPFEDGVELERIEGRYGEELATSPQQVTFRPAGDADEALLLFRDEGGDAIVVEIRPALGLARVVPSEELQ